MSGANVWDPDFDASEERSGFVRRRAAVGRQAGGSALGATLHVLEPGETSYPYHFHFANEELMVVLEGTPSLRTSSGWEELEAGAVVAHPVGEEGAHQVSNRSDAPVRFLVVSEMNGPEVVVYPDSGKIGAREDAPQPGGSKGLWKVFRADDAVDYFEDETPPK